MSQHLDTAIHSLSQEIDLLIQLRRQLMDLAGSSDHAGLAISSVSGKKSSAKKSAVVKRSGRPPVSEATRKKMAEARRAFFANKKVAAKKITPRKTALKKSVKKSAAKKGVAKKTAGASAAPA